MDDLLEPISPAQAQDKHYSEETSSQQSGDSEEIIWTEYDAETSGDNSWSEDDARLLNVPCGQCFELPCICPTCRFCRSKLTSRECSCLMATLWNTICFGLSQAKNTSKRVFEVCSAKFKLAQQSRPIQILNLLLEPVYAIFWWYKVYRCRKAVEAEVDQSDGYVHVFNAEHVANMVTQLADLTGDQPNIGFDMEANNLGHKSKLSYLQIRDYCNNVNYIVDLLVLQRAAWTTTGSDDTTTLKGIFEDPARIKLVFDCRQDSACLYAQAGVRVRGILDCQYLHMLTMNRHPRCRPGLAATVIALAGLPEEERKHWLAIKTSQRSHGTWEKRPVPAECKAYALGDIEMLRAIYDGAESMLEEEAIELATHWSAFEVARTWCNAKDYITIEHLTYEEFRICRTSKLLKDGIEPNPAPTLQVAPY